MNKQLQRTLTVSILILSLAACNLPEGVDPNAPDFNLTITANAALIETALASEELPPEAQGVQATEDPALPLTEEVVIPAAIVPPAVGDVTVTVSVATNCRTGPGAAFSSIYGMPVGQVAKVIAKNESSGYWIIEIPGQNGQSCWLWGRYATVTGDTSSLKVAVIPTSPATATPTATKASTATVTPTATKSVSSGAIAGCTDPTASNYNSAATVDDGSCAYPVTKPNAPTFESYICSVTGPDADGNYTFDYEFSWIDNSDNEDSFTVTVPEGGIFGSSINYPANSTNHSGSFVSPNATETFSVLIAANKAGSRSARSAFTTLICP